MAITVTLTPPLIAGVIYVVGFVVTTAFFVSDEMGFKNPNYKLAVFAGLIWPAIIVQVTILAPVFGVYIGDELDKLRNWWNDK